MVTGNKMRFEGVKDLVHFLFMWDDGKERRGWGSKPYRVIFQKSFELIERRLGYSRAERWLEEFFYLVRLTHWMLPYPSNTSLITTTKTSRSQGLRGRTMWFSAVYADPRRVQLPLRSPPSTLGNILRKAEMQMLAEGRKHGAWRTSELMAAYKCRGVKCDYTAEHWVAGKKGVGYKGFIPLWERGGPGELEMLEQIRDKSLEELEGLMAVLSQEQPEQEIEVGTRHIKEEELDESGRSGLESRVESDRGVRRSTSVMSRFAKRGGDKGAEIGESRGRFNPKESRSESDRMVRRGTGVMARFAARSDDRSAWVEADRRVSSTLSVSSGSVFVPSTSDRS